MRKFVLAACLLAFSPAHSQEYLRARYTGYTPSDIADIRTVISAFAMQNGTTEQAIIGSTNTPKNQVEIFMSITKFSGGSYVQALQTLVNLKGAFRNPVRRITLSCWGLDPYKDGITRPRPAEDECKKAMEIEGSAAR